MLAGTVVLITCALVFYSIGVWSEKKAKVLKPWHVIMFFCGLACDMSGTFLMSRIAASGTSIGNSSLNAIMEWTGGLALALMLIHAVWALVTLLRKRDNELRTFNKFSLAVWCVWLIPFVTGMLAPMF